MPSYVLVHGAWHTGAGLEAVAANMRSADTLSTCQHYRQSTGQRQDYRSQGGDAVD